MGPGSGARHRSADASSAMTAGTARRGGRQGGWVRHVWLATPCALSGAEGLRVDLPLEKPAEPPAILLLELGLHPVLAGDDAAAAGLAARAWHLVVEVVRGGPVVCQLFAGLDVPHRHEDDLPLDRDIRITGVIGVEHRAIALVLAHGRDEEMLGDLDFRRAELGFEGCPLRLGQHVASLDRDDLSGSDRLGCEQTLALDRAWPYRCLGGAIRQGEPMALG